MKVFITVFMKVRRHRVDHEPLPPTSSEADARVTDRSAVCAVPVICHPMTVVHDTAAIADGPPTDVRLRWYLKWPTWSIMGYESGRDSRERCTNGVSPPGARPQRADLLHRRGQRGRPSMSTVDTKGRLALRRPASKWGGRAGRIWPDTARWGRTPFPFAACSPSRGCRRVRQPMARPPPLRHSSPDRLEARGSSHDPRRPNRGLWPPFRCRELRRRYSGAHEL